jgi:putative NADH-flavin reductase
MKIAVIAANGRSGQAFVERALEAGHQVRGGIRGDSRLPRHACLTLVPCDATRKEDLMNLIKGQEAVVSLIGHIKGSSTDVQTVAIQNVSSVMEELGLKRLVSLTGTGVRFTGDKVTLIDRFLNLGVNIIDPARVRDGRQHVEVLQQTDLDWTVIRVLKLQNVPPKPYRLTPHGPTKPYVGREEVAEAILEVLENSSFIKQAPIISPAAKGKGEQV